MTPRPFAAGLLALLLVTGAAFAQRTVTSPAEGADWRQHAERYLVVFREDRPFSAARDDSRCVRMNNYGCLWQGRVPWRGTPGREGRDGAGGRHTGHAVFSHPKWSIVAAMRWFESRAVGRAPVTALDLASRYAPWCDTIGSKATKADGSGRLWGRGCGGTPRPPAGFAGPVCTKPADGLPTRRQCEACNCPTSVARTWLSGTGLATDLPLTLFDDAGRPNGTMLSLIRQKTALETGRFKPTDELLREAEEAFTPARTR